MTVEGIVGILLAAGKGRRFDASGLENKLLQVLPGGAAIAAASAFPMRATLDKVLAVVPPGAERLSAELLRAQCEVVECTIASEGMSASIVYALQRTPNACGWIVALADMPFVQKKTFELLRDAVLGGAEIAAPVYRARRGNPVAFGRRHLDVLLTLSGDSGARTLLDLYPVQKIEVSDPGICIDIDTPSDLRRLVQERASLDREEEDFMLSRRGARTK